jgi:hypothetical protein
MLRKVVSNKIALITCVLSLAIMCLSRCVQKEPAKVEATNRKAATPFAGSESCKSCHKAIYEDHLKTFHHLTSLPANASTINGSFDDGKNRFYFNPSLYIAAEKRDSGFYQVAYQDGREKVSRKFDFVIGSGKRGQTFLYWKDNYLFQLPLTWFTATNEWTNSPGYSNKAQFNRPITIRCLECHSTYFQETTSPQSKADEFGRSGILLGVECEKCHGPASEHVTFHQQHQQDTTGHAIINPAIFSRSQQLDMCRVCHGGRLSKTKPSFSFTAGDTLAAYFNLDSVKTNIADMDVHGNQYGMMSASKCFKGSGMTCLTCHDPHKNESTKLLSFASKCMTCHAEATNKQCKLSHQLSKNFLMQNCIDCHMPEEPSKAIMVLREGASIPTSAYMRSHYIAVYSDVANKKLSTNR